ncbi:MAG: hypothetical protein JW967_10940 [Dehalococcoidales bacterium]|nr:hypothetical protein [Dehalococcoidales bacterium]
MKTNSSLRSLTRSITRLFVTEKGVNPHKRYPDEYFKSYYFNKKLSDGIGLVARIEHTSKKQVAEHLMELGFRSYIGAMVKQHIQNERIARENNEKVKRTLFITELRKYAKEHGIDISKIF